MGKRRLDKVTQALLQREWYMQYGVLTEVYDELQRDEDRVRQMMREHPGFARALFQVQYQLKIAALDLDGKAADAGTAQPDYHETMQMVLAVNREEYMKLSPEIQQDIQKVRVQLGQPPIPPE